MLGSYFGSTKIVQGAGGLGQDGQLQAYADGVFGGGMNDAETPGMLASYQDGSLGVAPLQAYADGSVGGGGSNDDGTLSSYDDGIFGGFPAVEYDDGTGGGSSASASASSGGNPTNVMADQPAPIQSYQDGVFGGRGCSGLGDDAEGPTPISVLDNGVLGRPFGVDDRMYGGLRAYHDGSLGAVAGPVLDLGNQAALAEVKGMIGYASGSYALSADGQKIYTPDFYTSGIWEPSASALWQMVVSATPAFSGQSVSDSAGDQTFPSGNGLALLYAGMAAPSTAAMGPAAAAAAFPTIAAWLNAGGTAVLPPYLSIADKAAGARADVEAGMSATKMAMLGLGAAALLGLALVFRKKR